MNQIDDLITKAVRNRPQFTSPVLTTGGDERSRILFVTKQWDGERDTPHEASEDHVVGLAAKAGLDANQWVRTRVLPFACEPSTANKRFGEALLHSTIRAMQAEDGAWVVISSGKDASRSVAHVLDHYNVNGVSHIETIGHVNRTDTDAKTAEKLVAAFDEARKIAYPFG